MASEQYAPGTLIWIKSEEFVWQGAEVLSTSENELIVRIAESQDQVLVSLKDPIFLRSRDVYSEEGLVALDDLTQLTHLHEPAVLHSLQMRFDIDRIYTFTGPILIAVNPFKSIAGLYSLETLRSYISTRSAGSGDRSPFGTRKSENYNYSPPKRGTKLADSDETSPTRATPSDEQVDIKKPHVFATSAAAYRGLTESGNSQTILISGESGAGKTETTKFVMKFLALAGAGDDGVSDVERQVLESNPLLEALGNAKTLRNDNSSRFGKFIELQFNKDKANYRLCGARIHTYLLEKVRICDQQEGERNFHFFYQACAAAKAAGAAADASYLGSTVEYEFPQRVRLPTGISKQNFKLRSLGAHSNFTYLTKSKAFELRGVDDVEQYETTISAMLTIGIKPEEIDSIFACVSAVLNCGNLEFEGAEQSAMKGSSRPILEAIAGCLEVDAAALEKSFCNKTIKTATEGMVLAHLDLKQAVNCRDAAARYIYGRVFLEIVAMTNLNIGYRTDVDLFCGVLDIFGFECFKVNSFEQLCINYTNERLQQFFNMFVFKLEEALYKREGIPWEPLDFPDNQDSVDLLELKNVGIFGMLDEECIVPGGSDTGFVNKLKQKHKEHRRFDVIRTKQTWFVVKHFAGPVGYDSAMFLDKNKDQLSADVVNVLKVSNNKFIKGLFENDAKYADTALDGTTTQSKKKKLITVSSEFRDQLGSLMDTVKKTDPHFIRCIKPNPTNSPDLYDRPAVTEQLRYGGVLQVVQVSRAGYPVRIHPMDAWLDYKVLLPMDLRLKCETVEDTVSRVKQMLTNLQESLSITQAKGQTGPVWAVGKTLVFFKQKCFETISQRRLVVRGEAAVKIQARYREVRQRQAYALIKLCIVHVQALVRGKAARDELDRRRIAQAAAAIQKNARALIEKRRYRTIISGVLRVQLRYRMVLKRRRDAESRVFNAAAKIQATYRRLLERRIYKKMVKGIEAFQQGWRMKTARQQLKKLKNEAKEVGALLAKHQKAQNALVESKKKAEEAEALQLQLAAEKKEMQKKLEEMEVQSKKQAEEAARIAEAHALEKAAMVDSEAVQAASAQYAALEKTCDELKKENEDLKQEIKDLKEKLEQVQAQAEQSNVRYQQLLKSTAMQSMGSISAAKSGHQNIMAPNNAVAQQTNAQRSVDIQIVGGQGVGKTKMLEGLIKECDPDVLPQMTNNKSNFMGRYQVSLGAEKPLNILDCSGNPRAASHITGYFQRALWVFVVYDLANLESFHKAEELMKTANKAGAGVVFVGNKWSVEKNGAKAVVDVMHAKDIASSSGALSVECTEMKEAIKMILQDMDKQAEMNAATAASISKDGDATDAVTGAVNAVVDRVSSIFGANQQAKPPQSLGVLRPSLKGTKLMKQNRRDGDFQTELRPVQELQDSESAVTCICFGQEKLHKYYVLLAAASKDGTVVIYRCYRTEMEQAMLDMSTMQVEDEDEEKPAADANIAVHSRLLGHTRAITSIFFNLLEDQLVTTSIDKSVRFWSVESGEMLKVFTDSSPVPVASFLPFNPQVFVAANSNAVLRLVNVQNGMVLQKLKVETEVRALRFDDSGLFLLAGTKNGSVHVLEASDSSTLKFKFKVQLARGGVTCITFVRATNENPPQLLVNTSDSSVTIIDCTYGPPTGVLTNLTVRHRVKVAHSLLPLKCCHSPSGKGYLISGSEDKEVYIYSLGKGTNYKMQYLKHHLVPVVAVSCNLQDTLLASADSLGRIVLWRRMDFSHLPD